jgi:hypothetical protein
MAGAIARNASKIPGSLGLDSTARRSVTRGA